ncbi:MAG: TolC family protein [Terriglobales bacterium]
MSIFLTGAKPTWAEPLPFRRAIELAVQHSGGMAIAAAEQMRAQQSYQEARGLFYPQMTVGSGLAATWGFPLSIEGSAPSIIRFNSQQYLINAAQKDFIRAAKTEWTASGSMLEERRSAVILETALVYSELDKLTTSASVLEQQEASALKVEQIVEERVRAGVDSEVELTKARLGKARVHLRLAEAQESADVLRLRLAQLTGLPAAGIETVTESIPALPEVKQDDDLQARALATSPAIKVADQKAVAQEFRAKGEHKRNYPSVDFVVQYGLFSRHNNFDDFFSSFQRHNATVGAAIKFPFLNFAQRGHAEAADAEALKARKEAEGVKEQVSSETLRLQRSVKRLAAGRDVAKLEYQLARSDVDAVRAKVEAGTASLRDEQAARVAENDRYAAFLNASFELDRAQMQLLRATGDLEKWALP